jgi:GR25 family glycosyltransferase involved in LPS biosynthesis
MIPSKYNNNVISPVLPPKNMYTGPNITNTRDIPIFVINLDDDIKRWEFIKHQLNYLKSLNYQRVSAEDMRKPNMTELYKDDRISLYTKFTIQKKHRCDHKQIDRTGAIGATLSHYKIWRKMIDDNIPMAIIIEDDMHLMSNFYNILEKEIEKYNKEFDILNLGYLKNHYSDVDNSKFHFGTGCYVVTKEACEILCKYVFPIETHVDAYLFLLNHFGYIRMIMSDKDIIYHGGEFESNISHGNLKCDKSSTNVVINDNNNNSYHIITILLLIIVIIISIKLYLIHNIKL